MLADYPLHPTLALHPAIPRDQRRSQMKHEPNTKAPKVTWKVSTAGAPALSVRQLRALRLLLTQQKGKK